MARGQGLPLLDDDRDRRGGGLRLRRCGPDRLRPTLGRRLLATALGLGEALRFRPLRLLPLRLGPALLLRAALRLGELVRTIGLGPQLGLRPRRFGPRRLGPLRLGARGGGPQLGLRPLGLGRRDALGLRLPPAPIRLRAALRLGPLGFHPRRLLGLAARLGHALGLHPRRLRPGLCLGALGLGTSLREELLGGSGRLALFKGLREQGARAEAGAAGHGPSTVALGRRWVPSAAVPLRRPITVLLAALLVSAGACGDDTGSVGDERAAQVRDAAREAGLPDDVADVLALAAQGTTATFQVTYAGTEGARLVVSQAPPDRRVDVIAADKVIESRVLRGGMGYRCELGSGTDPQLECERAAGAVDAPGAFTDDALDDFTAQLAASLDGLELTVEERTIAGTDATCLVTQPKAGTTIDRAGPSAETLCVSPEGAQLLVDAGGDRLVAESYTTDVPEGTFEI